MKRGVAPMTISYKDQSVTFEMPGWYCDECDESIHTGDDLKVSDRMLNQLKARQKTNALFNRIEVVRAWALGGGGGVLRRPRA